MKSSDLLLVFSWFEWVHKQTIGPKRELHVAAKLLTNFKHSKGVTTFLLILEKKQLSCKISKERRIVAASVERLDNLSSDLWIIILSFIIQVILK